jgi:hypothetical protein
MAVIYKHIRIDTNEIFYIGIGKDIKRAYSKQNRNIYWKNIVNKTKYIVEIIKDNLNWEEACNEEIKLIKYYGRKDLNEGTLVNMTDGGEGNNNLSNEVNILKGKKISKSKKGVPNLKLKNQPKSEEHKLKIKLANIGKTYSEEINKKKGRPQIRELNGMYGKLPWNKGLTKDTDIRLSKKLKKDIFI